MCTFYMDFSQSLFWCLLLYSLPVLWLGSAFFRWYKPECFSRFYQAYIVVLSLTMLGAAGIETLLIFLFVTLVAYFSCQIVVGSSLRVRKIALVIIIPVLFSPLLYYKYSYFFGVTLFRQEWNCLKDLVIPIGLSFYSFQTVGFCVDSLLRGMPMPVFREYLAFCSFFPQIVAGPIERRNDLLPQMQNLNINFLMHRLNVGIRYIILGLFFKCFFADNLALVFIPDYQGSSAWVVWANNCLFSFRIYFDFAGYGLTAYGLARCFGIRLQMNFLSPYTATHIDDFWRRWHRSLTGWFRDYIYFPLGGSRTRLWALNLLLVFLISGLWHGAGWNFILWGGLSGIALVFHRVWRKKMNMPAMPGVLGWFLTMGYMGVIWMFFYDTDTNLLAHHCNVICSPMSYALTNDANAPLMEWKVCLNFLLCAACAIAVEFLSLKKHKNPYGLFLRNFSCAVMLFLMLFFAPTRASQFIYFVF